MDAKNTLLSQVTAIAREAAIEKGFYSGDIAVCYQETLNIAAERPQSYLKGDTAKKFAETEGLVKSLTHDEIHGFSRVSALDSVVLSSVRFATNAQDAPSVKEQIRAALKELKKGLSDDQFKKAVPDAIEKVVVNLATTVHPTVFHTLEAKRFEAKQTQILENPKYLTKNKDGTLLNDEGVEALKDLYTRRNSFIERLGKGATTITPDKPITLSDETEMEKENWKALDGYFNDIVNDWNEVIKEEAFGIPEAEITPELQKKIFKRCIWGQSADADGRDRSTAIFLQESIERNVEKGVFVGPTFELRQNAKLHEDLISALIQVKFRNSRDKVYQNTTEFAQFCREFMEDIDASGQKRADKYRSREDENEKPAWYGADKSIFQQLTEEDQADFLTRLIEREDKLVPDRVIEDSQALKQGLAIQQEFLEFYREQIESYRDEAGQQKYNVDALEYSQMKEILIEVMDEAEKPVKIGLLQAVDDYLFLVNGDRKFQRYQDGMRMMPVAVPTGLPTDEKPSPKDIGKYLPKNHFEAERMLQDTVKWTDSAQVKLEPNERSILMDTISRLVVTKQAIDQYGPDVANQHIIANFEKPADFLTMMKLFQDTNLIKVEKGKVTRADMDIKPLLETETDIDNGIEIFRKLLKNDLARSYWKARDNKATIILGFSDGSASAGNFASQWKIYQASRDLTELFAQHGIELEIQDGRGRGTDRGGTIEAARQFDLLPPERTCRGFYQATIQGDLPMDMAASPSYGKGYLTDILLGTLKSYVKGQDMRNHLASLNGNFNYKIEKVRSPAEKVIENIANKASEIYNAIFRNNSKAALNFYNNMPDNPFRTSRAAVRGGSAKVANLGKLRAIQKEMRPGNAKYQPGNAGLGEALDDFKGAIAENDVAQHPFFENIMPLVDVSLSHFDPEVAKRYGEATDSTDFVNGISFSLKRLANSVLQSAVLKPLFPQITERRIAGPNMLEARATDQLATALMLKLLGDNVPPNPDPQQKGQEKNARTLYNLIFSGTREVSNRYLNPRTPDGPSK